MLHATQLNQTTTTSLKSIRHLIPRSSKHWVGDGFHVRPAFNSLAFTKHISPFLMLDYALEDFEPNANAKKRKGVGQHPHRGFETVTIAYQGEIEHADSLGHRDVIKTGDVQWMTAGAGIVHEEFHGIDWARTGGTVEMVQLWVNLPAKHKMTPATYQALSSESMPPVALLRSGADSETETETETDTESVGTLRVIAGNYGATKGPGTTFSDLNVWDIELTVPGANIQLDVPETHNTMLLVRKGEVEIVDEKGKKTLVNSEQVVLFEMKSGSNAIQIVSKTLPSSVLLLSGVPFDEPIANMGPFVMNTQEELRQAQVDYRSGKF